MLGLQDALWLTIFVTILAIIAVLFVRNNGRARRAPKPVKRSETPVDTGEIAPTEAMLAG